MINKDLDLTCEDVEKAMKELTVFSANHHYINENREEFEAKYVDEYVAIHQQELVDHDKRHDKLLERLREKYSQDEIGRMAIDFVPKKGTIFVQQLFRERKCLNRC